MTVEELFPGAGGGGDGGEEEPPDKLTLDVPECQGCGMPHYDVTVRRVKSGGGKRFTHAYWCERSKKQMLVRLAKQEPGDEEGDKPPWKR